MTLILTPGRAAVATEPLRGQQMTVIQMVAAPALRGRQTTVMHLAVPQPQRGAQTTTIHLHSAAMRGRQTTYLHLLTPADPALRYGWPTATVQPGQQPQPLSVSCELGQTIEASYEDTGDQQTAQLTYQGRGSALGSKLPLTITGGGSSFSITLDVDPSTQERAMDAEGNWTHTVRLHNAAATRVASQPLPELISWHRIPRLSTDSSPLRTESVSTVVHRAFGAAGCSFGTLGGDPMAGLTWKEAQRDYSTEGKTARQVFDDAYGELGRLIMRGNRAFFLSHAAAGGGAGGMQYGPCALKGIRETDTDAHEPSQIRAAGPDRTVLVPLVPAPKPKLEEEIVDPETGKRLRPQRMYEYDSRNATLSQGATFFGENGEVVEEWTATQGTIYRPGYNSSDIGPIGIMFNSVLLSFESASFYYSPENPRMLLREERRSVRFGYEEHTQLTSHTFAGRSYFMGWLTGDLLSDEQSVTLHTWYGRHEGKRAGYLKRKTTAERRLAEVQQKNAEGAPEERGTLEPRTYVTRSSTESYYSADGEYWTEIYRESGGSMAPVYDAGSGEAVRLSQSSGGTVSKTRVGVTPPKVEWPEEAPEQEEDTAEDCEETAAETNQAMRTIMLTGGRGGQQSVDWPMAASLEDVQRLTMLYAAGQGPRTITEYELAVAVNVLAGQSYGGGIVDRVSISQSADGNVSSSVSVTNQRPASGRFVAFPRPAEVPGIVTEHLPGHMVRVRLVYDAGLPSRDTKVKIQADEELPGVGSSVTMMLSSDGRWVQKGETRERCTGNLGSTDTVLRV